MANRRNEQHIKDLERIKNFRLMDDDFMTRVFDGENELVQTVLRIIMEKDDLIVSSVSTQYETHNLRGRSVRLDVFAVDANGKLYDIEIQRSDHGAGKRRARYNSSLIDSNSLRRGSDHNMLPESYVIFITEADVIGAGLPIYHVERVIEETGDRFDDGEHIIYVNGENKDTTTKLGELVHDLSESDPDKIYNQALSQKVRYYKESEEGVKIMCRAMEEMRNEAVLERDKEKIAMKLRKGKTPEQIHEDDEYPMELIREVENELLIEA